MLRSMCRKKGACPGHREDSSTVLARNERRNRGSSDRRLRLEFSGNLIKHLGLSMYGGPVPALAELIANAWDADAHHVDLDLPLDRPLGEDDSISIKDDGRGMTWEEVSSQYLVIGRNRREGGSTTRLGRHVMGRKGIGKLAGFGIARIVEVRTVRNNWLTHFAMDYRDMTSDSARHARYEPQIIADEKVTENNSTMVILRSLTAKRAVPSKLFRESLARRFAVLDQEFVVRINHEKLRRREMPVKLRHPDRLGALESADIEGLGPVRFWYGFTKSPIQEADARGIAIMVRGRMAEPPSMLGIAGGVWNAQALEYLTGEVYADVLDENEDYISTDRQSINWQETGPAALQAWGQRLIKRAAREYDWDKSRIEREEALRHLPENFRSETNRRFKKLPAPIARVAERLMADYHLSTSAPITNPQPVRDIMTLAEQAAGLGAETVPFLLATAVERRDLMASLSERQLTLPQFRTVLRANAWLILSPWRLVLLDRSASEQVRMLCQDRILLRSLRPWVVRHENHRYIIALTMPNKAMERALESLRGEFAELVGGRRPDLVLIGDDDDIDKIRAGGVRQVSVATLIQDGLRSCEALVELLSSQ